MTGETNALSPATIGWSEHMAVKVLVQGPYATEAVAELAAQPGLDVVAEPVITDREKTVDPLTVLAIITTSVDSVLHAVDKLLEWREEQRARKTIEVAAVEVDGQLRNLDQLSRDELIALIRKLSEGAGEGRD
jgi:hypothetical protein